MNRVLEFIQEHLNEPLTLEDIAQEALLSKFHFHRIFKMVTSESLNEFIQRLRIEKSANILYCESTDSLTDIALNCGFSSSAYFSRVFKKHYGISATTFRKLSVQEKQQFIQTHIKGLYPLKNYYPLQEDIKIEIKTLPKMHLAYIRKFYFDLNDKANIIDQMFEYIIDWGNKKGLMDKDTKVVGVLHDSLMLTPFSQYQYDACITVPYSVKEDGVVGVKDIDEGKYVILNLRNVSKEEFERSIFTLFISWFPKSGYYVDFRPIHEFYYGPNSYNNYTLDYCVPIKDANRK
jgi:AraC family transcriptional regulator